MTRNSPFHLGELAMQELAGDVGISAMVGRCIEDSIPISAIPFLRAQSSIWLGLEDSDGFFSAFPLFGSSGFLNSNDGRSLEVSLGDNLTLPDEWRDSLITGRSVGCIVIQFSSRSRIRINGVIDTLTDDKLVISVQQAYPNCPKYIRKRVVQGDYDSCKYQLKNQGEALDKEAEDIIQRSDTAFVTSLGPNGADASHRGGETGFIKYESDNNKIIVPDYVGNGMFNTLGNFVENPMGGMIVCDFAQDYFLQLSGKVHITFEKDYPDIESGGTHRYWELHIEKWKSFKIDCNFQWESLDYSPYNP